MTKKDVQMGAYKQLEIPELEDTNENLVLFDDNTFQLFNYPEPKKLVPIKEILLEMRVAFEKSYDSNNAAISNAL